MHYATERASFTQKEKLGLHTTLVCDLKDSLSLWMLAKSGSIIMMPWRGLLPHAVAIVSFVAMFFYTLGDCLLYKGQQHLKIMASYTSDSYIKEKRSLLIPFELVGALFLSLSVNK